MGNRAAPAIAGIGPRSTLDDGSRMAAIDKALVLYRVLWSSCGLMRLSDLSRRTGMPKSTTHRLLNVLITSGMVVRFGSGYLAAERPDDSAVKAQQVLLRRLAPFVGDLFVRTRLTSSLAVLEDTDVVFAHRVYAHDNPWTPGDDTGRECAYRTATGRLLLSHDLRAACESTERWGLRAAEAADFNRELMRIKHDRCSVGDKAGITVIAVPVWTDPGHPNVALTVKGETDLIDRHRTLYWLRKVAHAASETVLDTASRAVSPQT
jgi:DNA-binding IclR family transcriptional regulator